MTSAVQNVNEPLVHITRVFNAPRALVFKAWTTPEHLMNWFAPRGCTFEIKSMDFREGGGFHTCIRNPAVHDCWARGRYQEIVAPERIIFTMEHVDEAGNAIEPASIGMDPEWPAKTTVTVTFEDLGSQTRMTLYQTVSEALAKRTGAHPSWLQMFDRLAEALDKEITS